MRRLETGASAGLDERVFSDDRGGQGGWQGWRRLTYQLETLSRWSANEETMADPPLGSSCRPPAAWRTAPSPSSPSPFYSPCPPHQLSPRRPASQRSTLTRSGQSAWSEASQACNFTTQLPLPPSTPPPPPPWSPDPPAGSSTAQERQTLEEGSRLCARHPPARSSLAASSPLLAAHQPPTSPNTTLRRRRLRH